MAVTRINNNQISDSIAGNAYVGVNAAAKLQDYSITSQKITNSLTYGSDLTITGNLTVNGQTTTIDTTVTTIEDPIIVLASNQTGTAALDIGFLGERGDDTNIAFVWDESADEFVTAFTSTSETNTTITISSYANFHTNNANIGGNLDIGGNVAITGNVTSLNVTGNITGGNLLTPGAVIATGNVTGGNLSAGSGIISTTGNVNGANVNASSGITAGTTVIATGNVTGGNITTGGDVTTATVTASGNITGGNLSAGSGIISTTGNINGANVNASSGITAGTTIVATGNITGGNLSAGSGIISTTGNVDGANLNATSGVTGTTVTATANVNGGNLITAGLTSTGTLETTGNAVVGGNLIVQGNITYINIDDLRVEDPIIVLGTGPNGAPLTTNDGRDRGVFMEYYTTGLGNAFMGWDNSTGNMVIANNVDFTGNDVVGVNSYGTLQAGNLYIQSAVSTGNVTGGNLITSALVSAATVTATGNITGGNLSAGSGIISTTGNINGANVNATSGITAGTTVIATGNITGGNITTGGDVTTATVTASGNITGGNLSAGSGIISTTGNVNGGNLVATALVTGANVTATANVTGANVVGTTSGKFGNIVITGDDITDVGGGIVTINSGAADVDFAVNGDTNANIFYVDAGTGTASFGSATQTTNAIVAFNATNSVLMPVGNTQQRPGTGVIGMLRFNSIGDALEVYDSTGWTEVGTPVFTVIADEQFLGDGSTVAFTLGSTQTTSSCIVSINGVVQIPTIAYSVAGTDPTCVLTFTEAPEPGDIIDVREITTTTTVTSISNTSGNAVIQPNSTAANVDVTGNLVISGSVSASSFIGLDATSIANGTSSMTVIASGGNIRANVGGATVGTFYSGGLSVPGIINSGANGVGNIGSSTGYFNTIFAQATSAQYADLAEKYVADAEYPAGTVVVFGGEKEVTVTSVDADRAVAGVVSTNPSYIMNGGLEAEFVSTVALTGRVPCRVTGTVRKGDLMVSAGYGLARAEADPRVGTVIGKALENHEGAEGVIEVVVGRF